MNPDDFPAPKDGFVLTHLLVVSDQEGSRTFYQSLFDGQVLLECDPVILKVANSWIILNVGGEPTVDKPMFTLTTPADIAIAQALFSTSGSPTSRRSTESGGPRARTVEWTLDANLPRTTLEPRIAQG